MVRCRFLPKIFALALALTFTSACGTRILSLADLASLVGANTSVAATVWHLENGANSIDLTVTPGLDATTYYAVYATDQGTLTASQVKSDALACAGACVAGGSFAATTAGASQSISALADKARYSVYAVTESAAGLAADADVKHYAGVLPRRLSMQTYATALNSSIGVGAIVRYYVYVPTTYYDNPTTNYPVMMYVHGGGEMVTDASNAESNFAKMDQTPFSALIAAGQDYPGLVVQPHCNNAVFNCVNVGSTNYLAEVVDQVNATYRTNPKKFSVIGMSYGGAGALDFAYDYPSKVSAVAGIAGGIFYRNVTAGTLCTKYATNKLALWGVNNTFDPWYNQAAVNGGGGAYVGDVVNTITGNCTGYPDARFTEYSDNTTFPVNFHAHLIMEFTLGSSPYYDYANCTSGNGFKSWNGTTCAADTSPTSYRIPMHPVMTAALAAASTALTGSATTFSSITDWLFYFEKP